jgi:site-specific DNA-cytosine methylase
MSCAQMALMELGIIPTKYYASEIKPIAIKLTQHKFPGTIQLGDIKLIKGEDIGHIDLFVGGSPCQDLSQANKTRLGLKGEKSILFYHYLRLYNELRLINPKIRFLLENVIMTDADYWIISKYMNILPINIDSRLVSAQQRNRLYWTDIGTVKSGLFGDLQSGINQPKDLKIKLQDILESGFTDRLKSTCIMEGWSRPNSMKSQERMYKRHQKGFTTYIFNDTSLDWKKGIRYMSQTEMERLQTVPDKWTEILSRNEAASLLGDGWTIKTIKHIFKHL